MNSRERTHLRIWESRLIKKLVQKVFALVPDKAGPDTRIRRRRRGGGEPLSGSQRSKEAPRRIEVAAHSRVDSLPAKRSGQHLSWSWSCVILNALRSWQHRLSELRIAAVFFVGRETKITPTVRKTKKNSHLANSNAKCRPMVRRLARTSGKTPRPLQRHACHPYVQNAYEGWTRFFSRRQRKIYDNVVQEIWWIEKGAAQQGTMTPATNRIHRFAATA